MTREELLLSPEYWTTMIQLKLYNKVEKYMEENNMTRTQLAEKLGVSKGYITQVLNGDYDHKISKLVDLSLAVGYYPEFIFNRIEKKAYTKEEVDNIISKVHSMLEPTGKLAFIRDHRSKNGEEAYCIKEKLNKGKVVA